MPSADLYQVVLLPRGEVVVPCCTLEEALAYQRGYHEVVQEGPRKAVIAAQEALRRSRPGRMAPSRRVRTLRSLRSA